MAVESAVVILDRGPEAQQHSAAAVFVADHGNRTVQVAESDPMIREVAFLPLETPKCKRNIEAAALVGHRDERSEEHTSELQSPCNLVCRLLLEKKNTNTA